MNRNPGDFPVFDKIGHKMMLQGFDIYPAQNSSTLGWLEVSGPDALDFLQRLTTVNYKKVRPTPEEIPLGSRERFSMRKEGFKSFFGPGG
jgi:hypothetical protein